MVESKIVVVYQCPEHHRIIVHDPGLCQETIGQAYICQDCRQPVGAHPNRENTIICDVCDSTNVRL